ncbi:hypothetical protein [Mucilaginibacter psychrotolerans]|uniref:hypothetical protein n=1 Tax=Mucilaginibacter psychrotolerans TaxID=1524096 RepID=UPI0013053100|nr:hypothetical protein [Mucilaginibacter psychrotolerans]
MEEQEDKTPESEKDWWDDLTDAQKENINVGLEEAEIGNLISSEEFWRRLKGTL